MLYVILICFIFIMLSLVHMGIMCPIWDQYDEYWKSPKREWLHYHILGPGSLFCLITIVVCYMFI